MTPLRFIRMALPDFEKVEAYLGESIQAGRLANFGPVNRRFMERLAKAAGLPSGKRVLTTSSGHTALMTAYTTLGVRRLVVPAFTFESTRAAAVLQGIEAVLVDVDARSGCLTPDSLKEIPLGRYDGVVAVCALSTIPDLARLSEFCQVRGKVLIIDGAATWGTPGVAHYGDAYCYSFHATKSLPLGEGGAVVLDADRFGQAVAFTNFGRDELGEGRIEEGRALNGKLSEVAAAIGLAELDGFEVERRARLERAAHYRKQLGDLIPPSHSNETVYAFLPLMARTSKDAEAIRCRLAEKGIPHHNYYLPIAGLPNTVSLYRRSVCVPVHSEVTGETIEEIIRTVAEVT